MTTGGRSIWDQMRAGTQTEEEAALNFMYPARNKFEFLQMLTEQQSRAVMPWTVLGAFRRKYRSKVLRIVQEEHMINMIARERKGRLEGEEILVGMRRPSRTEEE